MRLQAPLLETSRHSAAGTLATTGDASPGPTLSSSVASPPDAPCFPYAGESTATATFVTLAAVSETNVSFRGCALATS